MTKQEKYDRAYLRMALEWAKMSYCKRMQVGALLVKDGMIISDGFNGSPSLMDNRCENDNNETHWYVIHGEANCLLKCAKSNHNSDGATLYLTASPFDTHRVKTR